jgi:hypothetical protein
VFVVLGFIVAVTVAIFASVKLIDTPECEGAPYLYVTLHSADNVFKISRDGCLITEKVLWHGTQNTKYFRQVTLGNYMNSPVMYAAAKDEVLMYGQCSSWSNMRAYQSTVMSSLPTNPHPNAGAVHAYSTAQDDEGSIYASFQNTNVVLKYTYPALPDDKKKHADDDVAGKLTGYINDGSTQNQPGKQLGHDGYGSFEPAPLPEAVLTAKSSDKRTANKFDYKENQGSVFPGTFVQIGTPGSHNSSFQGVRGIQWVPAQVHKDLSASTDYNSPGRGIDNYNENNSRRLRRDLKPGSNQAQSSSLRRRGQPQPLAHAAGAPTHVFSHDMSGRDHDEMGTVTKSHNATYENDGNGTSDDVYGNEETSPIEAPMPGGVHQVIVYPKPKTDPSDVAKGPKIDLSREGHLWIAVENKGLVTIVDKDAYEVHTLSLPYPISIHYDSHWDLIFVGSRSKKKVRIVVI